MVRHTYNTLSIITSNTSFLQIRHIWTLLLKVKALFYGNKAIEPTLKIFKNEGKKQESNSMLQGGVIGRPNARS